MMSLLKETMLLYEVIFHPTIITSCVFVFALYLDLRQNNELSKKIRFIVLSLVPGLSILLIYYLLIPKNPDFLKDLLLSFGVLLTSFLLLIVYNRKIFGKPIQNYSILLILIIVIFNLRNFSLPWLSLHQNQ